MAKLLPIAEGSSEPQAKRKNRASLWNCGSLVPTQHIAAICCWKSGASVTAEVAGSSPVVPAIHSKRFRRSLRKPSRARKGRVARPFCALFLCGYVAAVSCPAKNDPPFASEEKTTDTTAALTVSFAWAATFAETLFGILLIAGFKIRMASVLSGLLLLSFAMGMVTGLGIKTPFDYSVFSAAAAAFLLAFWEPDRFTLDKLLNRSRN